MRCPSCRERLPDTPGGQEESQGARCPYCREPLFEVGFERRSRDVGDCAVHRENPAVGICDRCGNYICDVCRTRWRDRWLCSACVDTALEQNEVQPAERSAHARQAILSLFLSGLSWVAFIGILIVIIAAMTSNNLVVVAFAGLLFFLTPIPAVVGVGLGMAAIRARGDYMLIATIGLVLGAVNVGMFVATLTLSMAQNA
jgi:hypothetical protein